tara:strand:- start:1320 stop:1832 length:513 start_codon:yes stop_codon:yes gene_type:complete
MKKQLSIFIALLFIGCAGLPIGGSIGPQGKPGPVGAEGPKGPVGPRGPKGADGKSVPKELLKKIEGLINDEVVVGSIAYSFGIAPRITGFAYLTSSGKVYKLENNNPQKLGNKVELITQISKEDQFISLGRTTYGDDIKQFFTAVTMNGAIYTSEKLDSWTKMASIPLSK